MFPRLNHVNQTGGGQAHLAVLGVQAGVVPEAVADACQQVGHKRVVAGKCARHDIPMHDDVAHCSMAQPHVGQQAAADGPPRLHTNTQLS